MSKRACAQRPPGPVEEDPRRVEHHRQAQQEGEDVVAQPERRRHREPEHVAAHGRPQHDRDRQHQRHEESVAHVADHLIHRHSGVTAVAHHLLWCRSAVGLVFGGLGHRVAHVVGHRLARAVQSAIAHPVRQLGDRGRRPGRRSRWRFGWRRSPRPRPPRGGAARWPRRLRRRSPNAVHPREARRC